MLWLVRTPMLDTGYDVGLTHAADIKALAPDQVSMLGPAFKKYNEAQYTTVKLPGSSDTV